jgi:hypothetical protein
MAEWEGAWAEGECGVTGVEMHVCADGQRDESLTASDASRSNNMMLWVGVAGSYSSLS